VTLMVLLVLAAFAVWMWGLIDVVQDRDDPCHTLNQDIWAAIVFIGFTPAAVAWLTLGRPRTGPLPGDHERITETRVETREEFLARVRARAESQRSGTNR
jgi:hypothetical protein